MTLPTIESFPGRVSSRQEIRLVQILWDELYTHLVVSPKIPDPEILIKKDSIENPRDLTDESAIYLFEKDWPSERMQDLGTFFCTYTPGLAGGIDPRILKRYGLSSEESDYLFGFYFRPLTELGHERMSRIRKVLYDIDYDL